MLERSERKTVYSANILLLGTFHFLTICGAWLICYYIIQSMFILIRLIMNGTIRMLNLECAQAEQH